MISPIKWFCKKNMIYDFNSEYTWSSNVTFDSKSRNDLIVLQLRFLIIQYSLSRLLFKTRKFFCLKISKQNFVFHRQSITYNLFFYLTSPYERIYKDCKVLRDFNYEYIMVSGAELFYQREEERERKRERVEKEKERESKDRLDSVGLYVPSR